MEVYHILVIAGVISLVIEIFTFAFFFASAAVGLFCAAIANYYEYSNETQIYAFAIALIVTFIAVRPLFNKIAYRSDAAKTNNDAMLGKRCLVLKDIEGENNPGLVKLGGETWKAFSIDGVKIKEGENVEIVEVRSVILIVKKI